jgi:hypothetical protein
VADARSAVAERGGGGALGVADSLGELGALVPLAFVAVTVNV